MRSLMLVIAVAACGGRQREPAPAPPDASPAFVFDEKRAKETADGLLEVLSAMATIVERAGDCAAMAEELAALFDRAEPVFDVARTAGEDPEYSRMLVTEMKRHEAAVAPLVGRIEGPLAKCRGEPKVVEVMQRMPVL